MTRVLGDPLRTGRFDDGLAARVNQEVSQLQQAGGIALTGNHYDPHDYISIRNTNYAIAVQPSCYNTTWRDTHYTLQKAGLVMPTIEQFFAHYLELRDAVLGKCTLTYADGTSVEPSKVVGRWESFSAPASQAHKRYAFWLDNQFTYIEDQGHLMNYEHRLQPGAMMTTLVGKVILINTNVINDTMVLLEFDPQTTLPTHKLPMRNDPLTTLRYQGPGIEGVTLVKTTKKGFMLNCVTDAGKSQGKTVLALVPMTAIRGKV
jgi:hypothetical protein